MRHRLGDPSNELVEHAVTLRMAKHGIEVARIILGHSGIQATEIYAEADQQQAIEVMKKIG